MGRARRGSPDRTFPSTACASTTDPRPRGHTVGSYLDQYRRSRFSEKYLCVVYRFWPALKEVAGKQKLIFYTPFPSIKEATKPTTVGAKAMMSRWGKWIAMIVDPQVEFQTEGQIIKRPKVENTLPEEKPTITLFTDGKEEKARWAFIIKDVTGRIIAKRSGSCEGTTQSAEVTVLLLIAKKKNISKLRVVTDSDYCYKAGMQEMEYWKQRDFTNIKGEPLAHAQLWRLISETIRSMYIDWVCENVHTDVRDLE